MPPQVDDAAELERRFAEPLVLLFKHSLICPISARAFAEYEAFLAERRDVATVWLDVIGQRDLSRAVAERTGVAHQSPQALLLRSGGVVWHASHGAITAESLAEAVGAHSGV